MESLYWLIAMILLGILEAVTVSLVSLWFAGGALAAMVASLLGAPIWLQVAVFLVVSGILLACLRPLAKRSVGEKTKTNVDSLMGQQALVTEDIDNLTAQGAIRVNGNTWTARSTNGKPIPAETRVVIDRVEGVKLYVTPVKVPTTKA